VSLSTTDVLARPDKAADRPAPTPARRRAPDLRRWISPVALVALWQIASSTGVLSSDKLSSPWTVLQAGIEVAHSGELGSAFVVSLTRVASGFLVGAAIAAVLGVVAGLSRWGEVLVDPPVQMLRTLPFLGLIPLFILWFGIGEQPKIALVALGVAFPLYLNIHSGIRNADDQLIEATTASPHSVTPSPSGCGT
jgi:sulfonate transport system permease protein